MRRRASREKRPSTRGAIVSLLLQRQPSPLPPILRSLAFCTCLLPPPPLPPPPPPPPPFAAAAATNSRHHSTLDTLRLIGTSCELRAQFAPIFIGHLRSLSQLLCCLVNAIVSLVFRSYSKKCPPPPPSKSQPQVDGRLYDTSRLVSAHHRQHAYFARARSRYSSIDRRSLARSSVPLAVAFSNARSEAASALTFDQTAAAAAMAMAGW